MSRDVLSYMNTQSMKVYNKYQVSAISLAIKHEPLERAEEGLKINGRTKKGKELLNKRIADIANRQLTTKDIVDERDVYIYKICNAEEYQDRTGRCAWGFKDVRKRMGYDEITGVELDL